MPNKVEEFNAYRAKMNEKLLDENNKLIKRIFNLDTNAFMPGALDVKTKELLGLVASAVLRCDDCVKYHLESSKEEGATKVGQIHPRCVSQPGQPGYPYQHQRRRRIEECQEQSCGNRVDRVPGQRAGPENLRPPEL